MLYTIADALAILKKVKLINKYKFVETVFDENVNTFVIPVAALEVPESTISMHPLQAPLLAALQEEKVPSEILGDYEEYTNVFSPNLVMELPENTEINKHVIKLMEGKKLLYGPIYSLSPLDLRH